MSVIPPSDPIPSNPMSYLDSPVFSELTQEIKDTLTQSLSVSELDILFSTLPAPTVSEVGLEDFFSSISGTIRELQQQLQANELTDQKTRRRISQAAAIQADLLLTNIKTRDEAIDVIQTASDDSVVSLSADINEISLSITAQNANSDAFNGFHNNKTIGQQIVEQNLIDSYNTFITIITAPPINAVGPIDGQYTIDTTNPTVVAAYNDAANNYQSSLTNFNNYYADRHSEIDTYNDAVNNYNNDIADPLNPDSPAYDIAAIAEITGLTEAEVASMYPPIAITIPPSGGTAEDNFPLPTDFPTSLSYDPDTTSYQVDSAPPLDWIFTNSTSQHGASYLSYSPVNPNSLFANIHQNLYDRIIVPLDLQNATLYGDWAYSTQQTFFFPPQETAKDPLLNAKVRLIKKLFPDTTVNLQDIVQSGIARGANALNALNLRGTDHIQNLLSNGLVGQIVNQFNLKLSKDQAENFTERLTLLTTSLLKNHSIESILPSLGPLLAILSSLPANSPAFSLLYAISLANRMQERSDLTADAIKAFIETQIPELSGISQSDLASLAAAINTKLLLVSANLLATTLGLPALLPQITQSVLSQELSSSVLSKTADKTLEELGLLNNQLNQTFQSQGFGPSESQYLANFATTTVLERLSLAPSATSISANNIQVDILKASITAGLIHSGYLLDEAQRITDLTVDRSFARLRGNTASLPNFINSLELSLKQASVDKKDRIEIATEALLLPTSALSSTNPLFNPNSNNLQNDVIRALQIGQQMTESELASIVREQTLKLLTHQVGSKVANVIAEQANISLFGISNPDSSDVADVKAPFSLINVMKHQISLIVEKNDVELTEKVVDLFQETIQPTRRTDILLELTMNPAFQVLYSSYSGIMYSDLPKADKTLQPRV